MMGSGVRDRDRMKINPSEGPLDLYKGASSPTKYLATPQWRDRLVTKSLLDEALGTLQLQLQHDLLCKRGTWDQQTQRMRACIPTAHKCALIQFSFSSPPKIYNVPHTL